MTDKAESGKMQDSPIGAETGRENVAGFREEQPDRDYLDGFLNNAADGTDGTGGTNSTNSDGDAAAKADQPGEGQGKDESESKGESESEDSLEDRVVAALRAIYDPEIPVNIYDLGLIYGIEADADAFVTVTMTLTTPHCPVAEIMPAEVEQKAREVEGVSGAVVNLVWDPPWDPSRMSEEAQLELGFI